MLLLLLHMRVVRMLGACLLVAGLSGCSLPGAVGRLLDPPQPDPTLLHLYAKAVDDSLTATEPAVAGLRKGDADELAAEITRLCGHYEDGTTPPSCEVAIHTTAPAPFDATVTLQGILDSLGSVPQESLPVVMDQYLELVAFDSSLIVTEGPTVPTAHPEATLLGELWDSLLDADYALGVVLAGVAGDTYAQVAAKQQAVLAAQDYLLAHSEKELPYEALAYQVTDSPLPLEQRIDDQLYQLTASATTAELRQLGLVTLALTRAVS